MNEEKGQRGSYDIRVLLVDDQALVGKVIRLYLSKHPEIKFLFVQNPKFAIQQALAFKPTVILQDLVMPDIEGIDLVHTFHTHPQLKNIPLIVLSGKEDEQDKTRAFDNGATDYLVKPPARSDLIERIKKYSQNYAHSFEPRPETHKSS